MLTFRKGWLVAQSSMSFALMEAANRGEERGKVQISETCRVLCTATSWGGGGGGGGTRALVDQFQGASVVKGHLALGPSCQHFFVEGAHLVCVVRGLPCRVGGLC